MPWKRTVMRTLVWMVLLSSAPRIAAGQTWPERPVKMIIVVSAGGSLDTLARIVSDKLSDRWRQGVVVENRPGGAGNVGAMAAARSAPDGYTLHMAGQSLTANITSMPATAPNPITDFEPIVFVAFGQDVLMVPKESPYKSVQDLVVAAKANPKGLNYSSLGIGSSGHLATIQFQGLGGFQATHVPYSSIGQMQTDLVGGRMSFWLATLGGALGSIKSGQIRALAVSGEVRATELPDVLTFKEQGIDLVEPSSWYAIMAPKGLRSDIIARINADTNEVLNDPEMRKRLSGLGFLVRNGTPEALAAFMNKDVERWKELFASPAYKEQ